MYNQAINGSSRVKRFQHVLLRLCKREEQLKLDSRPSSYMCGRSKYLTLAFCLSAVLLRIYLMKVTL